MKLLKRLGLERRPVPRDPEKFEVAVMVIQVENCVAELSRFSQERGLGDEQQGPYGFGDLLLVAVAGPRLDDAARELALHWDRQEGSNEVEGGGRHEEVRGAPAQEARVAAGVRGDGILPSARPPGFQQPGWGVC